MSAALGSARLLREAELIARLLKKKKTKIVLAESCTGGLVAASLASVPGISDFLCGSSVVYRIETKARWLGVSRQKLKHLGAVSGEVATQMAQLVLRKTPEADFGFSVTGYLGPSAPQGQAGRLFLGCANRKSAFAVEAWALPEEAKQRAESLRRKRQELASLALLFMVRSSLE